MLFVVCIILIIDVFCASEIIDVPTSKPLPEEQARKCFCDAVLGLEYCEFC